MPADFQARVTWTPTPNAMAHQATLYLAPEGESRTEIGFSSLGPTDSEILYGVSASTRYEVEVVAIKTSGSSAPLVIAFTTPPSLTPSPTNGGVTFEPNS